MRLSLCRMQLTTGHDSSDDRSPENIAMLALATFSTCYNLPVYLHYNITYRRTFLRMLRCNGGNDSDAQVSVIRPATVHVGTAKDRTTAIGAADEHSATFGRRQQDNDGCEPPTSQRSDSRPLSMPWTRRPQTRQLDASDVQRY